MSQRNVGNRPDFSGAGRNIGRLLGIGVVVVLIGIFAFSTFKFAQIDEGERGIVITQGAVESIQEPGIFFRVFAPFTKVEIVNIKRQTRQVSQNVASSDKQLYDIDIQVDSVVALTSSRCARNTHKLASMTSNSTRFSMASSTTPSRAPARSSRLIKFCPTVAVLASASTNSCACLLAKARPARSISCM